MLPILKVAALRIKDISSIVRKKALKLLITIIQVFHNIFCFS